MSTSTLQQFFGRHDANWNLYATKEQRQTKVTIGFLSLILMIGATMWIAEGAFIQYSSIFSSPACSEVAKPIQESRSTRYCAGQWRVYIQGWRMSDLPEREGRQFAWHKAHIGITLGMGLMFVTINYLWWMWEKGLVSKYTAGFADKAMPSLSNNADNRHLDVRTDNINYVVRFLTTSKHLDWYFAKYLTIIFLTGAVIIGQFAFVHLMLGTAPYSPSEYVKLYDNMMEYQHIRMKNRYDNAVLRFPTEFSCLRFDYGPSGTLQSTEVNCDNEANSWVECFYISNIFILYILIGLYTATIVQTMAAIKGFKLFTGVADFGGTAFENFGPGKKLIFLFMAQNLEELFWADVILKIKDARTPRD